MKGDGSRGAKMGPLPFDPETLTKYESVRTWLANVSAEHTGSDRTRECYLWYMTRWVQWTGKNPDQLKEERRLHVRSEDDERYEENKVNEYFAYLQKIGFSRNMSAQHLVPVRSFYTAHGYNLKSKQPQQVRSLTFKPPMPEELEKLWQFADVRDRAIIAWIVNTGMSRGDVVQVKWKHIKREWGKRRDAMYIDFMREKTKERYETFLGDEGIRALELYFEQRQKRGEQPFIDDAHIFVSEHAPYEPMTESMLGDAFTSLRENTGIVVSAHRLRKYFDTYLAISKVHPVILKYWMGHAGTRVSGDVEKHYIIPPVEEQRKLYLAGYERLRIQTVGDEIQELRLKTELKAKGIDADAERAKHPNWTDRDHNEWMKIMARQEVTIEPKTTKSDDDATYYDNHVYHYCDVRYGTQTYRKLLMEDWTLKDSDGEMRTFMKRKEVTS